jgi:hypothetical protein
MKYNATPPLVAIGLLGLVAASCVSPPAPRVEARLTRTALYEQQVEEGFGRLDQLPRNPASLPR